MPQELAPFAYNESIAQDNFPLTKEEALQLGFRWEDDIQKTEGKETTKPEEIPDNIKDVQDSITGKILKCMECNRNYKITKMTFVSGCLILLICRVGFSATITTAPTNLPTLFPSFDPTLNPFVLLPTPLTITNLTRSPVSSVPTKSPTKPTQPFVQPTPSPTKIPSFSPSKNASTTIPSHHPSQSCHLCTAT